MHPDLVTEDVEAGDVSQAERAAGPVFVTVGGL